MITYQVMSIMMANKIGEIDRSETIEQLYEMDKGKLLEVATHIECENWDADALKEIQDRFIHELNHGGMAIGAFDAELLVGFGVLGHQFLGKDKDQLPLDLMYVSRNCRRKGIGTKIMEMLGDEAKRRGAKYLYISSSETGSAVSFYRQHDSEIAAAVDETLFKKEPKDIHMVKKLH